MSEREVDRLARERGLHVYDTALPWDWFTEFGAITGLDPRGRVVWCYDAPRTFGAPVGLDDEMAAAVLEYEARNRAA